MKTVLFISVPLLCLASSFAWAWVLTIALKTRRISVMLVPAVIATLCLAGSVYGSLP
jgi:hypothetical protein